MEVSGPPCDAAGDHILGDAKKAIRTDILNLVSVLQNHLDCDINIATKIRVFSTHAIST